MELTNFAEQVINELAPEYIEQLKSLSAKYADYRQAVPAAIKVRNAQNDIEKQNASKTAKNVNWIVGVGIAAFAFTTIFAFATGQIKGGVISLIGTIALLYFFLDSLLGKAKIAYGTAVWKHYRYMNHTRPWSQKMYYLTVIFEQPEKIIVQDIQTTKEVYDAVVEGTPVMVIKKGTVYQARMF